MCVCVCACTHVCRCTPKSEGDGRYCSSTGWIYISVLKPGLSLAWACLLGLTGWPESLGGPPVSFSPALGLQAHRTLPSLLFVFCRNNLGACVCLPSDLLTELFLQPFNEFYPQFTCQSGSHFLCKLSYVKVEFPPHPCEPVEVICVISH